MELSAKYVRMIWEKKSFSAAATSMFVSQPALSTTVKKLEDELGFKIFDRSTTPISLTLRGQIYMDYLNEIYEHENTLKQRLRAVDDLSYGSLTIGGRMYSAYYILPVICGEFYRRYPGIHITVDMDVSPEKIKSKAVNLMLSFSPDNENLEAIPLLEERLIVAIHKEHPSAKKLAEYALTHQQIVSHSIPSDMEISDFSIFSDIPFIKTGKGSDSDKRLSQIMKDCKASPYVVVNAKTFDMRYRMMQEGIGAVFVSDLFISEFLKDSKDIYYFALQTPLAYRTLYILCEQNHNKNQILDKFIATAIECCQKKKILAQMQAYAHSQSHLDGHSV